MKNATAPVAREAEAVQQTFAPAASAELQSEPVDGRVDASPAIAVDVERKGGGQLVEVSAGAANTIGPEIATRVDVEVNAPSMLTDHVGSNTLVDASTGATTAASSESAARTVHTDAGSGGNAASASVSLP